MWQEIGYRVRSLLMVAAAGLAALAAEVPSRLDLSGVWQFQLDPEQRGIEQRWFEQALADSIVLPGTTDLAQKGRRNDSREAGRLTRRYPYYGAAWYQRDIDIPEGWQGKRIVLTLERTKVSQAWIDGRGLGSQDSLVAPHLYELGTGMAPGRHRLALLVNNKRLPPVGDPHQVSDQTQTNWNGVIGRIELAATDSAWIDSLQVYGDPATRTLRVRAILGTVPGLAPASGTLQVSATSVNRPKEHQPPPVTVKFSGLAGGQVAEALLLLGNEARTWDEFSPEFYRLEAKLEGQAGGTAFADRKGTAAGLRSFVAQGTQFQANGRTVFLRGKHDACVFPLTGHPPMDKAGWLKVMRVAQSYGINHYRFHTWCPPEAAFDAADELGLYLQPELPNWRPFQDPAHDAYMLAEGKRLLDAFGNHPSFVMLSLGNEMGESRATMAATVSALRAHDPRHLYAQGSNNFFWDPSLAAGDDYWTTMRTRRGAAMVRGSFSHADQPLGRTQAGPADTLGDFTSALAGVPIPVVGHETGQYQVFPDLTEIPKYTGVLEARNFERIRDRLQARGMLDQAAEFVQASGALAALCYREDNELAFRTPGFAGFQILDLQDFPGQGTALVGILNAFMESKGLVAPETWRETCAPVVLLARFPSYTWTNGQTFTAILQTANYGPGPIPAGPVQWSLRNEAGARLASGELAAPETPQGSLTTLGSVSVPLARLPAPARLTLELRQGAVANHYPLWIYPEAKPEPPPAAGLVAKRLDKPTLEALDKGARVLLMPSAAGLERISVPGFFAPDFWCWPMFHNPPGTLGLLMDPKHPALAGFPTGSHSDWQWFDIAIASRPVILDGLPAGSRPIVQVIDNFDRCHRLGLVSEFTYGRGRLLLVACDLEALAGKPAPRQLLASLRAYVASEQFRPSQPLPTALLEELRLSPDLAAHCPATADSVEKPELEPGKAVDGSSETRWCAADAATGHWWRVDLGQPRTLAGATLTWENARNYRYLVEGSPDGTAWTILCDQRQRQDREQTHRLKFEARGIRHVRITVTGLEHNCWASLREVKLFGLDTP